VTVPATRCRTKRRTGADLDLLLGLIVVIGGTCGGVWWWTAHVRVDLTLLDQVMSVVLYRDVKVPRDGYALPSDASCMVGRQPTFGADLAPLKQAVGEAMGQPVECEHVNPDNGDLLQQTTTGLAVYRESSHVSTFTDGWRHWMLAPDRSITWVGTNSTPPLEASQLSHHETQQG
jgi:hypothetical protein